MASLSTADIPLTGQSYRSVTTGSSPRHTTAGGGRGEIDGIDPEKADILNSSAANLHDVHVSDRNLDPDGSGWDEETEAMSGGGLGKGGRATVWRSFVCKYRYVLAGVAVLVLASMVAGIAIGATKNKNGGGGGGATSVSSSNEQEQQQGNNDKGLDVPEVTVPDEPQESGDTPQSGDENDEPYSPGAGKPPSSDEDKGKGKGTNDDKDGGRSSDEDDDKKGRNPDDKDKNKTPKTDIAAASEPSVNKADGNPSSLSFENRRRRILGSLRKMKPAKENRGSAAKEKEGGIMMMEPSQKTWHGAALEEDKGH